MTHLKFIVPAALLAACVTDGPNTEDDGIALEEARLAVVEANLSGQPDRATADGIDVSTTFGPGDEALALGTIADFWTSQAPCSTVDVDGNAITVDFGSLADACSFNGQTYAGIDTITVMNVDPVALAVEHDWNQFTNGNVTLDGSAAVAWTGEEQTRRVFTDYVFANFVDASIVHVEGDHVTGRLDPELPVREGGFTLDGTRTWTSANGAWSIEMHDLEILPQDPAPQAGSVDLENPNGKRLSIAYERVDADTIAATVMGPDGLRRLFHIDTDGDVESGD